MCVLYDLGDNATLKVEAEGGMPPYTYSWYKLSYDADYEAYQGAVIEQNVKDTKESSLSVSEPFTAWKCVVEDLNGEKAVAYPMRVDYDGDLLIIIQEPEDIQLDYTAELYSATLTCKAFINRQYCLDYTWEKKDASGWKPFAKGPTHVWQESVTDTYHYYITGGVFRCRVTVTETGKEVLSREVKISLPPLKASAYQVGKSMTVKLEFEGGVYPYKITCDRWRYAHHSHGWYSLKNGKPSFDEVYETGLDLSKNVGGIEIEGYHRYVYTYNNMARRDKLNYLIVDDVMDVIVQHRAWTYVFHITDAQGNTVTVDTGEMKFDK